MCHETRKRLIYKYQDYNLLISCLGGYEYVAQITVRGINHIKGPCRLKEIEYWIKDEVFKPRKLLATI